MSLTLSAPAVRLPAEDVAALPTTPVPTPPTPAVAPARPQVYDVVDDWGLASFPASDPPSNW